MRYRFERIKKGSINIDKIHFQDSNKALDKAREWMVEDKALDKAREWMVEDKDLDKVRIETLQPKSPYKIEIERC